MSVLSALALFLTTGAAVANPRVEQPGGRAGGQDDKRIAELEARVAELEDAIATANAHARRDQELIDLWRERALAAIPGPPAGFGQAAPQIALHHAAAAMQQQQNAAQYAQYQGLGLLGAQMIDAELYCNCVPSRSQVWAANG